ncbi:MAG TPA: hypothetical protein VGI80_04690 [Pyrinomonadaceae bacterium]
MTSAKGSVAGIVSAPGLTNASGVKITLHGADASTLSQTTGADGRFVFYDILPGTYSVEVDPTTLPQKYRVTTPETIDVQPGTRAEAAITLEPRRSVVGRTYLDVNGDGVYSPEKDTIVEGAQVSLDGEFAVSGPDGTFRFDELPAGRMSLVVCWPGRDHTTHVVLDLGEGPVTDRIVNVPLFR